ncbi:hypothetical protein ACFS07_26065 [Undibacterium arcticum]
MSSSLLPTPEKLADVLTGGTKHNFSKHVIAEYRFLISLHYRQMARRLIAPCR